MFVWNVPSFTFLPNHNYVISDVFTAMTEEFRLLGYKTPVRTSQETHYLSAKEHSQLILCKV
jgi:hypothetical protein